MHMTCMHMHMSHVHAHVIFARGCVGEAGPRARTNSASAMVRLAANLSFLFKERPFLERFQAARAAGFRAVRHASLDLAPLHAHTRP